MTDQSQPTEAAELARLADGTLPAERETELRAKVERSPELAAALAQQRRAISLMRAIDEPAPASLRAAIDSQTAAGTSRQRGAAQRPQRRRRWRPSIVLPVATAMAVVAAALVLLIGGASTNPTIPDTVRVTLAAATLPAPAQNPTDSYELALGVGGVHFPNWRPAVGWKTSGARIDKIGNRAVATVFYTGPRGHRVGYAIVSGAPLAVNGGRPVIHEGGVTYTLQRHGSTRLVTWVRSGHTCVIAGRDVSDKTLLKLATSDNL